MPKTLWLYFLVSLFSISKFWVKSELFSNVLFNSSISFKCKFPVNSKKPLLIIVFIYLLFFLNIVSISSLISSNCPSSINQFFEAFDIINTANLEINCELFS